MSAWVSNLLLLSLLSAVNLSNGYTLDNIPQLDNKENISLQDQQNLLDNHVAILNNNIPESDNNIMMQNNDYDTAENYNDVITSNEVIHKQLNPSLDNRQAFLALLLTIVRERLRLSGGNPDVLGPALKRTFAAWGGKRNFNAWGGKRQLSALGGKKRKFNAWGGKRDSFNAWGGKRDAFNAWGGKRGKEYVYMGRVPVKYSNDGFTKGFYAWGGKRSVQDNEAVKNSYEV